MKETTNIKILNIPDHLADLVKAWYAGFNKDLKRELFHIFAVIPKTTANKRNGYTHFWTECYCCTMFQLMKHELSSLWLCVTQIVNLSWKTYIWKFTLLNKGVATMGLEDITPTVTYPFKLAITISNLVPSLMR